MGGANLKLDLRVLGRRKVFTAISLVGIALTLVVLVMAMTILDNAFGPGGRETRLDRMLMMRTVGRDGPHTSDSAGAGCDLLQNTLPRLPDPDRTSHAPQGSA